MVLNRPWSGQLIHRIYYLLYFKSLSGSCPESRRVSPGVGVQGMPAEQWNKPDQLEQKE